MRIIILFIILLSMTTVFAQDRTVMNRHKFYDTTDVRNNVENRAKYKERRLTADVDSSGIALYAWGNECYFKISLLQRMLINANFYQQGTRPNGTPYMLYGNDNFRFRMYINNSGNFEFDAIIRNKSPQGRYELPFNIDTKNLDFYYQPELTQEEINEGVDRPDSVINSYAVYHSTKRNNYIKADGSEENYGTGKAFHIFRPKVWDNAGDTVWGTIRIDTVLNMMFVGVDSTWLANAVHPVTIDPEFGHNASPASETNQPAPSNVNANIGTSGAMTYVASSGDELTEIHFWARTYGSSYTLAVSLYEMSDASTITNLISDGVTTITVNTSTLADRSVTGLTWSLSASQRYCLVWGFGSGTVRCAFDTGTSTTSYDNTQPFPATTMDATWTQSGTTNNLYAIWGVYTEGGGGPTAKSQVIIIQ